MEKHIKMFLTVVSAAVATCPFADANLVPVMQKMSAGEGLFLAKADSLTGLRRVERMVKTYGRECGYDTPVREVHIVQHPVPGKDGIGCPLYVVLHSSGHDADKALDCTFTPGNHDMGNSLRRSRLERFREVFGYDYASFKFGRWRFISGNTQYWYKFPFFFFNSSNKIARCPKWNNCSWHSRSRSVEVNPSKNFSALGPSCKICPMCDAFTPPLFLSNWTSV